MKILTLVISFLLIFSLSVIAYEQAPPENTGPDFSEFGGEQGFQELVQKESAALDAIRSCKQSTLPAGDPQGTVQTVEILGIVEDKCKVRLTSNTGQKATYSLPNYQTIQGIATLLTLECEEGNCGFTTQSLTSKPEQTEDKKCVEKCVMKGCDRGVFECMSLNQKKCDQECGMITEPEAQNEEEQCIRDCLEEKGLGDVMCSAGTEMGAGEQNPVCQECADSCVHLYAGPCLTDEKITEKENVCTTKCEHCYGELIMGDSGEGYECIVDIKCADASAEFGDEPGEGPGIGQEGYIAPIKEFFSSIGNFFSGLFGEKEPVQESLEEKVEQLEKTENQMQGMIIFVKNLF